MSLVSKSRLIHDLEPSCFKEASSLMTGVDDDDALLLGARRLDKLRPSVSSGDAARRARSVVPERRCLGATVISVAQPESLGRPRPHCFDRLRSPADAA